MHILSSGAQATHLSAKGATADFEEDEHNQRPARMHARAEGGL